MYDPNIEAINVAMAAKTMRVNETPSGAAPIVFKIHSDKDNRTTRIWEKDSIFSLRGFAFKRTKDHLQGEVLHWDLRRSHVPALAR